MSVLPLPAVAVLSRAATVLSDVIGTGASSSSTVKTAAGSHDFDRHLHQAKQSDRDTSRDDTSSADTDSANSKPAAQDDKHDCADGKSKPAKSTRHTATDEAAVATVAAPTTPATPADNALATAMLGLLGQRADSASTGGTAADSASATTSTAASGAIGASVGGATNPLQNALGSDDDSASSGDDDGDAAEALLGAIQAAQVSVGGGTSAADGLDASQAKLAPTPAATASSPLQALQGLVPIAGAPASATASTGSSHQLSNSSPVGSSGFAQELGQQVTWLSSQDIKQANIRLHPQDLGQLDVKVSLSHGRVDVAFAAQHPAAVHAVQQSLGQLDQLLSAQGMSLGQTSVGQQALTQQQFGGSGQGGTTGGADSGGDDEEIAALEATPVSQRIGLLDAFA